MSARERQLSVQSDGTDPRQVALALKNIRDMVAPSARVNFGVGAETANTINVDLSVSDFANQRWERRWPVTLWLTPTLDGDPSAAGNTVVIPGPGFTFATLIAGAAYLALTGPQGTMQVQITVAGAATRFLYAWCGGREYNSGPMVWT